MTIYYRYWAQIQDLGPNQKVFLSVGILSIILSLILKVTYRLWRSVCYRLSLTIRVGWYLLISNFYYDTLITMKQSVVGRKSRERQNLFSERMQKKYGKTKQAWETLKDRQKSFSLAWGLLIYFILICFILLPRYVKFYMPVLSEVSLAYGNIERKSLEEAHKYEPFWTEPEEPAAVIEESEQIEEEPLEIWLRLSEKGRAGSNVRESPDKDSDRIIVISGEVTMKQLELSGDERWIRIELEDGTQGWINHTLVEVIE